MRSYPVGQVSIRSFAASSLGHDSVTIHVVTTKFRELIRRVVSTFKPAKPTSVHERPTVKIDPAELERIAARDPSAEK